MLAGPGSLIARTVVDVESRQRCGWAGPTTRTSLNGRLSPATTRPSPQRARRPRPAGVGNDGGARDHVTGAHALVDSADAASASLIAIGPSLGDVDRDHDDQRRPDGDRQPQRGVLPPVRRSS